MHELEAGQFARLAETPDDFQVETAGADQILDRRLKSIRAKVAQHLAKLSLIFLGGWAALSAAAVCGDSDSGKQTNREPTVGGEVGPAGAQGNLLEGENLELPWFDADNQTWFFTGGPHADGLSRGKRYALDFAPDKVGRCPGPAITDRFAASVAAGKVIAVGNENNFDDPNHSIVEEKLDNGLIVDYMHLSGIVVHKGDRVAQGQKLGNPSCEVPPGGGTTGLHVHLAFKDQNGNPLDVNGLVLSGWRVVEGSTDYEGIMTKYPLPERTADTRRCGPSVQSIAACGGIRNDLRAIEVASSEIEPGSRVEPRPTPTEVRPTIQGLEIKSMDEIWVIPGLARIKFNGIIIVDAVTIFNGLFQEEYASFDITNDYGLEIGADYNNQLELEIILPSGRVIYGNEYGYSKHIPITGNVQPHQTATKVINFADNSLVEYGYPGLVDTRGAIVILTYHDSPITKYIGWHRAAWQLP